MKRQTHMADSNSSLMGSFSALPDRIVQSIVTNWGLFSMVLAMVAAGAVAFYFIAVPPGSVQYP